MRSLRWCKPLGWVPAVGPGDDTRPNYYLFIIQTFHFMDVVPAIWPGYEYAQRSPGGIVDSEQGAFLSRVEQFLKPEPAHPPCRTPRRVSHWGTRCNCARIQPAFHGRIRRADRHPRRGLLAQRGPHVPIATLQIARDPEVIRREHTYDMPTLRTGGLRLPTAHSNR